MKLKTLKDIQGAEILDTERRKIGKLLSEYDLKSEAIKHYNRAKELRDFEIMWWIRLFFNLTEEDLK